MAFENAQPDALARVYARSLFELAQESGGQSAIESTMGELEELVDMAREDAAFGEFLSSQILSVKARAASLKTIFEGRVSRHVLNFLQVLNAKGRLGHLAAIAAAYDEMLQKAFGRVEVDVFTAQRLDEPELDAIGGRLRSILGKEPVMHTYVDESMIGGLRLRIGDQLVDASVATQLRRMRERLDTHGAAELRNRLGRLFED